MKKGNEITLSDSSNSEGDLSGDLAIHIPRREFGNFIKSLLGQPYEVSRAVWGQFDLTQDWVNQLIYLISQRVSQQNDAQLVEFSGVIGFSEGLEKRISSLEAFTSFVETTDAHSSAVSFKITYLIKFPGKEIPEKQQISFAINGYSFSPSSSSEELQFVTSDVLRRPALKRTVSYRIESTERTWADDIENLIKTQLRSASVNIPKSRVVFDTVKSFFIAAVAICALAVPVSVEYMRIRSASKYIKLPEIPSTASPAEAISAISKMLYDYVAIGVNFIQILYYIAFAIACIIFSIYLASNEDSTRTYVIYNKSTDAKRREFRDRQNRTPFYFFRDIVIAIVIGLISNLIFLKWTEYFQ